MVWSDAWCKMARWASDPVWQAAARPRAEGEHMQDAKVRIEEDLLGERAVPAEAYYGIHTLRAVENFQISDRTINQVPAFIKGMVKTKQAAALANGELGCSWPDY